MVARDAVNKRNARTGRPSLSPGRRFAVGAFAWSLAFGLVSVYWAAGGTIGESTLAKSIRDLAEERKPAFVATLWITGAAKILGGLLPLSLGFTWWRRIPRRLLVALCGVGGVLLMLYGIADMVRSILILLDIGRSGEPSEVRTAWWYFGLWGPVWVVGGALYLATGLIFRGMRRADRLGA